MGSGKTSRFKVQLPAVENQSNLEGREEFELFSDGRIKSSR